MLEVVDCHFERDAHSYLAGDGMRVPSVTQVIQLAGLHNYDGIPAATLDHAAWRGTLVHEATAHHDQGVDVEVFFDLPEECLPYFRAYKQFLSDTGFTADSTETEKPRIVTVNGMTYGMTPDRVGTLDGIPTVLEIKNTAAVHPCWGIQLAGYEQGIQRPARYRDYQRVAVQLKPDETYRLHSFTDPSDFSLFAHAYSVAAWKLNNRITKLAA